MPDLGLVHARFARAVILIYLGAGALAVALLVAGLVTDQAYHQDVTRNTLLLETQVRAHYLGYHLRLLVSELKQLSQRSEINPPDRNIDPERALLRLAHEKSSFFNVGVAVVSPEGLVLWAEPESFLPRGLSLAGESWYQPLLQSQQTLVVPVQPERERDSLLYIVSPVIRDRMFAGALLGAVDLAMEGSLGSAIHPTAHGLDVLVTRRGAVIYPAKPPSFSSDPKWAELLKGRGDQAFLAETTLAAAPGGTAEAISRPPAPARTIVAGAPVAGTDFLLLSLADADQFFRPAWDRMKARMAMGLALFLIPLLLLVVLLRRSFRVFRQSEEQARRDERLRMLGEAVSLIAHEVRNSLNGLRVGLDLILKGDRRGPESRPGAAAAGLRAEMERLSSFTTELLGFSKGVVPRPISLDLADFGRKVTDLARPRAESLGISLAVSAPEGGVPVKADPSLIHVIVANLVGNALDALSGDPVQGPSVQVSVERSGRLARLQVRDNGPGVPLGLRTRLFDPFVTGKPSGVGIGLALSRKIARAHGGELALEPAAPGAAFTLTLPLEAR